MKHEYSMKHLSGGFPSERWRFVVGISRREAANQGSPLPLHAIAQTVTPPAASVQSPHGFDWPPLHSLLAKGKRQRLRSCSGVFSQTRAITFFFFNREEETRTGSYTSFLVRAREYGSELTCFCVSVSLCGRAHTCNERHGCLSQ